MGQLAPGPRQLARRRPLRGPQGRQAAHTPPGDPLRRETGEGDVRCLKFYINLDGVLFLIYKFVVLRIITQ